MKPFFALLLILSANLSYAEAEFFFSPKGGATERIIKAIDSSTSTIDILMYSFTSRTLANALIAAHKRGVILHIALDRSQSFSSSSMAKTFITIKSNTTGFYVRIINGLGSGIMHDKVGIFDNKLLCFGSFNWTDGAERRNSENLVFTDDQLFIRAFTEEFTRIWTKEKK